MIVFNRRAAAFAALFILAAALASCGDSEADQRKAFIGFLQTRIIDKPGVHVPSLTDDEKSSLGSYYDHYMVIGDFNREMSTVLTGPYKIAQTRAPQSIQEMMERHGDVKAMTEAMSRAATDARKLLADAEAKRAALKQPDDLKPIYAAAFERSVTAPAQAFLATIPVALDQLTAALALADYLDNHRAMVKITGSNIQTADNKTRADVTQLLTAMNVQNQRFKDAQERMRVVTQGR